MPPHLMMAGHRPYRHHLGVPDEATGEPTGEPTSELGVVLEMPLTTVPTAEPAPTPHQRRAPAAHPRVTNPLRPPVPHPGTAEPTLRAARPLPARFHLHLQAVNRIDPHPQHAHTRQVQTNRHTSDIEASWHRRTATSPIPARPHPQTKDSTPPNPHFRAGPSTLETGSPKDHPADWHSTPNS